MFNHRRTTIDRESSPAEPVKRKLVFIESDKRHRRGIIVVIDLIKRRCLAISCWGCWGVGLVGWSMWEKEWVMGGEVMEQGRGWGVGGWDV